MSVVHGLLIDYDINRLIDIDYYRLTSIFVDYWFQRLITPGRKAAA